MATELTDDAGIITELRTVRWGAIFAGAVAALGTWALLYALGLAIGLSTVDTQDTSSWKFSGMFTGIWGVVTPLVALFVGGFVAGRGAGISDRGGGALHGFVMWGLTALAGAWLLVSVIGGLVGGLASAGKAAAQNAVSNSGSVASAFGLDANAAVGPINQRLQAEGKPTVTPDQLQAAVKDSIGDAAATGHLNRDTLVKSLASNTALSQQDANEIAGRVEQQYDQFKSSAGQKVQAGAGKAASVSGKAMWGVFLALVLGLIAALVGGFLGVGRIQRVVARRPSPGYRPLTPREA
jgi:hypothetical protein